MENNEPAGHRALVLGAGLSGFGAASLLKKMGYGILVYDDAVQGPTETNPSGTDIEIEIKGRFKPLAVKWLQLEEVSTEKFNLLITSPGIPRNHPVLLAVGKRNIPWKSEIDLAFEVLKKSPESHKIVGVTGTNGKSTVVEMITYALNQSGVAAISCGNIGDPLSLILAEGRQKLFLVCELSSYQLDKTPSLQLDVGIFTNFAIDHLQYHGTIKDYFRAKWHLVKASNIAILGSEVLARGCSLIGESGDRPVNPSVPRVGQQSDLSRSKTATGRGTTSGEQAIARAQSLGLLTGATKSVITIEEASDHRQTNRDFAVKAVSLLTGEIESRVATLLEGFVGLPHRLEKIAEVFGFDIINDSKATNVHATCAALRAIGGPKILILGGRHKGESFAPILAYKSQVSHILAFGESRLKIASELKEIPTLVFVRLADLMEKIPKILNSTKSHILFSPACASFDQYSDFADRGLEFKKLVAKMLRTIDPK